MTFTISMDKSGRVVIPKAIREKLHLSGDVNLRAQVAAGRIELTPVGEEGHDALVGKGGITVLKRRGRPIDVASAVATERSAQSNRGMRR